MDVAQDGYLSKLIYLNSLSIALCSYNNIATYSSHWRCLVEVKLRTRSQHLGVQEQVQAQVDMASESGQLLYKSVSNQEEPLV